MWARARERLSDKLDEWRVLSKMDSGYRLETSPIQHPRPENDAAATISRAPIEFDINGKYGMQRYEHTDHTSQPTSVRVMVSALYDSNCHPIGPMAAATIEALGSTRVLVLPNKNFTVAAGIDPNDLHPTTVPTQLRTYQFTYRLLSPNIEAIYYTEDGLTYLAGVCYFATSTDVPEMREKLARAECMAIRREFLMADHYPLRDRILYQSVTDHVLYGRECGGKRVLVRKKYGREIHHHIDVCYRTLTETRRRRCRRCRRASLDYDFMAILKQRQEHRRRNVWSVREKPGWMCEEGRAPLPAAVFRPKLLFMETNPCETDVPDPEREKCMRDARVQKNNTFKKIESWWEFLRDAERLFSQRPGEEPTFGTSAEMARLQREFVDALRVIQRRMAYVCPNDTNDVLFASLRRASDIFRRIYCKQFSRSILKIDYAEGHEQQSPFLKTLAIVKNYTIDTELALRSDPTKRRRRPGEFLYDGNQFHRGRRRPSFFVRLFRRARALFRRRRW